MIKNQIFNRRSYFPWLIHFDKQKDICLYATFVAWASIKTVNYTDKNVFEYHFSLTKHDNFPHLKDEQYHWSTDRRKWEKSSTRILNAERHAFMPTQLHHFLSHAFALMNNSNSTMCNSFFFYDWKRPMDRCDRQKESLSKWPFWGLLSMFLLLPFRSENNVNPWLNWLLA